MSAFAFIANVALVLWAKMTSLVFQSVSVFYTIILKKFYEIDVSLMVVGGVTGPVAEDMFHW